LVEVKNPKAQSIAMKKLLENRSIALQLSLNASHAIREKFKHADTMLDRYFDKLLEETTYLSPH
jgi:hypothetical protein